MKFFITLLCLLAVSCKNPVRLLLEPDPVAPASLASLVDYVDSLSLPLKASLIVEDGIGGATEYDPALRIDNPTIKADPQLPHLSASLIGTMNRPMAVIFSSSVSAFYVPFPGVTKVDRKRRLSKIQDRVYRIESNRRTEGVEVTFVLP